MPCMGFSQLVQVPTTDSGLLDHIYCNGVGEDVYVDVIDAILIMMPTYPSWYNLLFLTCKCNKNYYITLYEHTNHMVIILWVEA